MVNWSQRTFTEEEFRTAFNAATSIRDIARKLSLAPSGGTYHSVYTIVKELDLDLEELSQRRHVASSERAKATKAALPTRPPEELLVKAAAYSAVGRKYAVSANTVRGPPPAVSPPLSFIPP